MEFAAEQVQDLHLVTDPRNEAGWGRDVSKAGCPLSLKQQDPVVSKLQDGNDPGELPYASL